MNDNVYRYTAEQAVADGVLVHPYPKAFPWALLTAQVHAALEQVAAERETQLHAVIVPLIIDAAMVVQAGHAKDPDETLWTKGLEDTAIGDVWVALNEMGGLTILYPSDY